MAAAMDLKQLQYFLGLAHEGNMTRAARKMNIVQPALSMQIKRLESELGHQLFYRRAKGVTLTAAGEVLARLANGIADEFGRIKAEMARLDGTIAGRVSMGMITSVAHSTLATSSATIAERYPGVRLSICEGYTDNLVELVLSGQLDLAIINVPQAKIPLAVHPILDERMLLAFGNEQRSSKISRLDHLEGSELVLPSRRHGLRRILDSSAAELGLTLEPKLEVDTLSAICEIVIATQMITILPGIVLHHTLLAGRLNAKAIGRSQISRSIGWIVNPRRPRSEAAAAVVDIIATDLRQAAAAASKLVSR